MNISVGSTTYTHKIYYNYTFDFKYEYFNQLDIFKLNVQLNLILNSLVMLYLYKKNKFELNKTKAK